MHIHKDPSFFFTKSIRAPVGDFECWPCFLQYNPSIPRAHFAIGCRLDQMVVELHFADQWYNRTVGA
jgi:hypothetical protein